MSKYFFVSYARDDSERIQPLLELLKENDVPVWSDEEISGGDDWEARIGREIRRSCGMILIVSRASTASTWVTYEASSAVNFGKTVFPLLLDEDADVTDFPDPPASKLRKFQSIDVRTDFDSASDGLLADLKRKLCQERIETAIRWGALVAFVGLIVAALIAWLPGRPESGAAGDRAELNAPTRPLFTADVAGLDQKPQRGRIVLHEYKLGAGDVLAVVCPGVVGKAAEPAPVLKASTKFGLPPATGYPVVIEHDGFVSFPFLRTRVELKGLTLLEAERRLKEWFVEKDILRAEAAEASVSLLVPRMSSYEIDPEERILRPGDVLGLYIPGISFPPSAIYDLDSPFPIPPVHYEIDRSDVPPGAGHRYVVNSESRLILPYIAPINVADKTLSETRALVNSVYQEQDILLADTFCLVTLIRPAPNVAVRFNPDYSLDTGDLLAIQTIGMTAGDDQDFHEPPEGLGLIPARGQLAVVLHDGSICVPGVGRVTARDLTVKQLRSAIDRSTNESEFVFPEGFIRSVSLIQPRETRYDVDVSKYVVKRGDSLGIYVPGAVGNEWRDGRFPEVRISNRKLPAAIGREFVVRNDGRIQLPLVGFIDVSGKTLAEIEQSLQSAFVGGQYLRPSTYTGVVSLINPSRVETGNQSTD